MPVAPLVISELGIRVAPGIAFHCDGTVAKDCNKSLGTPSLRGLAVPEHGYVPYTPISDLSALVSRACHLELLGAAVIAVVESRLACEGLASWSLTSGGKMWRVDVSDARTVAQMQSLASGLLERSAEGVDFGCALRSSEAEARRGEGTHAVGAVQAPEQLGEVMPPPISSVSPETTGRCERNVHCVRGYRHCGRGGLCSLSRRAADNERRLQISSQYRGASGDVYHETDKLTH